MRGRVGRLPALWVALAAAACGPAPSPEALAVWPDGEVTRAELDAHLRTLPSAERRPDDGDFTAWHRRRVEDLASAEILLAEASATGVAETPEHLGWRQEIERQLLATLWLRRHASVARPDDEELDRVVGRQLARFMRPEQRLVYHLYRRADSPADLPALEGEMRELRRQVLGGRSFTEAAATLSDSELRHRGGLMGWVVRGQLAPAVEAVVFALEEKVPSEPVRGGGGIHVFWVETALEATRSTRDSARSLAVRGFLEERLAAVAAPLESRPWREGDHLPTDQELRDLWSRGNDAATVLRFGDYRVSLGALRAGLGPADAGAIAPTASVREAIEGLTRRERLYRAALDEGLETLPELRRAFARMEAAELVRRRGLDRVERALRADRVALREHFERRRTRYVSDSRWRLRWLEIPLPAGPAAERMAALEAAVADGLSLAEIADRFGGTQRGPVWKTTAELASFGPVGGLVIAALGAGEVAPPFHLDGSIQVVTADARDGGRELSFEEAEDQVVADLRRDEGGDLWEEMKAAVRREHGVRLLEERIAGLAATGGSAH